MFVSLTTAFSAFVYKSCHDSFAKTSQGHIERRRYCQDKLRTGPNGAPTDENLRCIGLGCLCCRHLQAVFGLSELPVTAEARGGWMRPAPAVALRLGGPIWRLPWGHRHGVDMPRLRALVLRAGDAGVIYKKTVFLSHLHVKTIFLPRQAREKHRESTQKRDRFVLAGGSSLQSVRFARRRFNDAFLAAAVCRR